MNLVVLQDGSERVHYNNPQIPVYISRDYLHSFTNMSPLSHWHDDVEFILPFQGNQYYNVNGVQILIPEGSAIFVNARQIHHGYSQNGQDCGYLCITFRPQLLSANEHLYRRFILPILTAVQLPYFVLKPDIPAHRPLLEKLRQVDALYRIQPECFEMLTVSVLLEFWILFYQLLKEHIDTTTAADTNLWIIRQMMDHIRTHYSEKLTVDAIAAAGGVCRTRCCQIFRKYLGITPNEYLNSFRLEQGMELLKCTALPVTEIAAACGFASASYFTELFVRRKGCTPSQYRRHS